MDKIISYSISYKWIIDNIQMFHLNAFTFFFPIKLNYFCSIDYSGFSWMFGKGLLKENLIRSELFIKGIPNS